MTSKTEATLAVGLFALIIGALLFGSWHVSWAFWEWIFFG